MDAASIDSTSFDVGPDTTDGSDAVSDATRDAAPPGPPQVVDLGGPVLAAPVAIPVFFTNDDATTPGEVMSYLNGLASSTYWTAALQEYGVGALTIAPAVTDGAATNTNDAGIQAWLARGIAAGTIPPPAGRNVIYALFYPTGIVISDPGSTSCMQYLGYHSEAMLADGTSVSYAVLPRCAAGNMRLPSELDVLAVTVSHEFAEAATDPFPLSQPAWERVDDAGYAWDTVAGGSEIGDLCVFDAYLHPADIGHYVQRLWSNASALAGHDPCGPEPAGEVYFHAVAEMPDTVAVASNRHVAHTPGVNILVGQTRTIQVDLSADGSLGAPWTVTAEDLGTLQGTGARMTLVQSATRGAAGNQIELTITPTAAGSNGRDFFLIASTFGTQVHYSAGVVDGECSALDLSTLAFVTPTVATGTPPASSGGTIVPGTYHLTAETVYSAAAPDGGTAPMPAMVRTRITWGSNTVERAQEQSGRSASNVNGTFTTTPAGGYSETIACPQGGRATNGTYTATPTSVTLSVSGATSTTVAVYTLE